MISKRVSQLKASPTLALAAKAKELAASGLDVISLSVGEPDWPTVEPARKAAINLIEDGKIGYAPAAGLPGLRKLIAEDASSELGIPIEFENVSVTSGAKFSIFAVLQCLINPGDEVVIPSPFWVSYPTMVELAEGLPIIVQSDESSNFKMTAEAFEKSITEKTKLVMLNSPNNPTGFAYTSNELKAISEVLKKNPKIMIMSDDIYNNLCFDGRRAPHILDECKELLERTILINGVSKTYSMTGWRVGWSIGPKHIIKAVSNYQSQSVTCASQISQVATMAAIRSKKEVLPPIIELLNERLNIAMECINSIEGLSALKPDGAFYVWLDIRKVLGKKFDSRLIRSSREFCSELLSSESVVAVPGVDFGMDGFIRVSFALENDRLKEAFSRISNFCSKMD